MFCFCASLGIHSVQPFTWTHIHTRARCWGLSRVCSVGWDGPAALSTVCVVSVWETVYCLSMLYCVCLFLTIFSLRYSSSVTLIALALCGLLRTNVTFFFSLCICMHTTLSIHKASIPQQFSRSVCGFVCPMAISQNDFPARFWTVVSSESSALTRWSSISDGSFDLCYEHKSYKRFASLLMALSHDSGNWRDSNEQCFHHYQSMKYSPVTSKHFRPQWWTLMLSWA